MNLETLLSYFEQQKQEKIANGQWNQFTEIEHNKAVSHLKAQFQVESDEDFLNRLPSGYTKYLKDPTLI